MEVLMAEYLDRIRRFGEELGYYVEAHNRFCLVEGLTGTEYDLVVTDEVGFGGDLKREVLEGIDLVGVIPSFPMVG